jgi:hypothetical protein
MVPKIPEDAVAASEQKKAPGNQDPGAMPFRFS